MHKKVHLVHSKLNSSPKNCLLNSWHPTLSLLRTWFLLPVQLAKINFEIDLYRLKIQFVEFDFFQLPKFKYRSTGEVTDFIIGEYSTRAYCPNIYTVPVAILIRVHWPLRCISIRPSWKSELPAAKRVCWKSSRKNSPANSESELVLTKTSFEKYWRTNSTFSDHLNF